MKNVDIIDVLVREKHLELRGSAWHCSQLCVRKAHMMIRRQKTITHKNNYKI